ncbi:hypothetical protein L1049_025726 [Liquidambar formosana]|uniref:FAF domain-containing protein n=1 Tax=Liquidambar formosana TaxID=63359 RepID=A0AAP0R5U5_LIQFO
MQSPEASPTHHPELGLEALTLSSEKEQSPNPFSSSIMLSPPSPFLMGDYIGMESCFDLKNNVEIDTTAKDDEAYSRWRGKRDQRWEMRKKREFPPPIPSLARTGNLPCHMPWIFKRYYTNDGRLIIKEEKVRHHEYFRAHRANGRLTLHLVPLDNDVLFPPTAGATEEDEYIDEDAETETETEDLDAYDEDKCNEDNDEVEKETMQKDQTVVEEATMKLGSSMGHESSMENGSNGIAGKGGGAGKCFEYKSIRRSSSPCSFGMPLPSIRPVHS